MKRLILIFALLILLPVSLDAGRGFTGTDIIVAGSAGTALDISTGPMTVSAWFYPLPSIPAPTILSLMAAPRDGSAISNLSRPISVRHRKRNNITFNVGGGSGCLLGIYGTCGTITTGRWYFVLLFVDSSGKYYGSPTAGVILSGYSCGFWAFRDYRISGAA